MTNKSEGKAGKDLATQSAESPRPAHDSIFGPITPYDHELKAFGQNWCGPERFSLWQETLVARYEKDAGSDGQSVLVYCTPAPARFYTAKVQASPNSVGERQPEYSVSTGSGQAELIALISKKISEGMLGFDAVNEPERDAEITT